MRKRETAESREQSIQWSDDGETLGDPDSREEPKACQANVVRPHRRHKMGRYEVHYGNEFVS
jgi:hypothetical protein